jgi:dolichol-phosphate mannosyltransferase
MSATDRYPHRASGGYLREHQALASRLGKFLVVGGTGVVLNNVALYAFYQLLRLPLVVASALAVTLAIANNYLLNDRWTFSRKAGSLRRFVRFTLVSLVGLTITTATLWALVTLLGVHYLVANVVGIALGTGSNFFGNLNWTWSGSGEQ